MTGSFPRNSWETSTRGSSPDKRKRLGEFYTPKEVVDFLLRETALSHENPYPRVLDPACGSGSFLVRYLRLRVEEAKAKGVALDPQALSRSIWGFDLNPFAVYVSASQLLWEFLGLAGGGAGLPLRLPEAKVYHLDALSEAPALSPRRSPGEEARDGGEWDYVVGNPPYVRAERAKSGPGLPQALRGGLGAERGHGPPLPLAGHAGHGEERPLGEEGRQARGGGLRGLRQQRRRRPRVVPPLPRGEWSLRKLVWLEFAGRVWEANVVPMVLVLERTPPGEEDEVEVWVPSSWPKEAPEAHEVSRVRYRDFFDPRVNPRGGSGEYGEYLLPLLREEDISLLKKLYPGGPLALSLREAMERREVRGGRGHPFWWTYGVQRGGAPITPAPTAPRSVPVLAGRGVAVAWPGEVVGYVDLERVRAPGLWGDEAPGAYLAVANIALVPFGALVRGGEGGPPPVALDTLIVGVPRPGLGEAVAAYLNSSLARWYYLVRLRSGVLGGGDGGTSTPAPSRPSPGPGSPRKTSWRNSPPSTGGSRGRPWRARKGSRGAREGFVATLAEVDRAVFDLFGLSPEEREGVMGRLGRFPLDRFRPRYPWEAGVAPFLFQEPSQGLTFSVKGEGDEERS